MKSKVLLSDSVEPDLIDRIANALPESVRSDYYLLMRQVPADVVAERERLEHLFTSAMRKVEENLRSCMTYQKLLDDRLSCLPDQIKKGISPDVIAGNINESLRQQFVRSTIPQTAEALTLAAEQMKQTTAEFGRMAGHLTDSYRGVAAQAGRSISEITSSIRDAAEAARFTAQELSSTFRQEYRGALYALSCLALASGIGVGMLFQHWLDRPPKAESEIQHLASPIQPAIHIPKRR
jgi:hypothetical protein